MFRKTTRPPLGPLLSESLMRESHVQLHRRQHKVAIDDGGVKSMEKARQSRRNGGSADSNAARENGFRSLNFSGLLPSAQVRDQALALLSMTRSERSA
jgi:hypothetical protein